MPGEYISNISGSIDEHFSIIKKFNLISQNINLYLAKQLSTDEFNKKFIDIINNHIECEFFNFEDQKIKEIITIIQITSLYSSTITCDNHYVPSSINALKLYLDKYCKNPLESKLFFLFLTLNNKERVSLNLHVKSCNIHKFLQN
jgi:hypothetical protein